MIARGEDDDAISRISREIAPRSKTRKPPLSHQGLESKLTIQCSIWTTELLTRPIRGQLLTRVIPNRADDEESLDQQGWARPHLSEKILRTNFATRLVFPTPEVPIMQTFF
jgi:hypothetical protein